MERMRHALYDNLLTAGIEERMYILCYQNYILNFQNVLYLNKKSGSAALVQIKSSL